jgi:FkbM family methyltransferase
VLQHGTIEKRRVLFMFDHPLWREKPVHTAYRLLTCKVRQSVPSLSHAIVPYDGGQSRIEVDVRTRFGYTLYRYGHHDPDISLVRRLLASGDVFVDGGAHIGLFTLVAAAKVGLTGQVFAFEPAPETRRQLLRNVELSGFSQVDVSPMALADRRETRSFTAFDENAWGSSSFAPPGELSGGKVEQVQTVLLDEAIPDVYRSRLRLLKLDLEGAEYAALRGAQEILAACQPDLLIEMEPENLARQGASASTLCDLLKSYGYRFFHTATTQDGSLTLKESDPVQTRTETEHAPNVFASVDISRLTARGLKVEQEAGR